MSSAGDEEKNEQPAENLVTWFSFDARSEGPNARYIKSFDPPQTKPPSGPKVPYYVMTASDALAGPIPLPDDTYPLEADAAQGVSVGDYVTVQFCEVKLHWRTALVLGDYGNGTLGALVFDDPVEGGPRRVDLRRENFAGQVRVTQHQELDETKDD